MNTNYQEIIAFFIVGFAVVLVLWRLAKSLRKKTEDECNTGHHCDGCSQGDCGLKDIASKSSKKNVSLNKK